MTASEDLTYDELLELFSTIMRYPSHIQRITSEDQIEEFDSGKYFELYFQIGEKSELQLEYSPNVQPEVFLQGVLTYPVSIRGEYFQEAVDLKISEKNGEYFSPATTFPNIANVTIPSEMNTEDIRDFRNSSSEIVEELEILEENVEQEISNYMRGSYANRDRNETDSEEDSRPSLT